MNIDEYENLPAQKKVESGDLISFYFPAKGSIKEVDLIAEKIFETWCTGKKIMMVRASKKRTKFLEIFKGKAQFDYSASYDLDFVTLEEKAVKQ